MSACPNTFNTLLYAREHDVVTLTLNRPAQKNALDMLMREDLAQVTDMLRRDPDIRAVILGGAGDAFCAGGDIRSMATDASAEQARTRMRRLLTTIETLLTLECPVIAKVDGPAYGAGLSLALTADLVLATPRARFCASFLRLGALPDCGVLYTLPRMIGLQRAKELIFSTREFDAAEAKKMGIVLDVLAPDVIDAHARQIALSLAELPASALAMTKRALNASLNSDLHTMLELEASGQGVARSTAYHHEAVKRFLAKQTPRFQWPARQATSAGQSAAS